MSSKRPLLSAARIDASSAASSLPCSRIESRMAVRRASSSRKYVSRSSNVRNCESSRPPVTSLRYRAINGTVAPPSSSVTVASTCCSRTPSSCAILPKIFATPKPSKWPRCLPRSRGDAAYGPSPRGRSRRPGKDFNLWTGSADHFRHRLHVDGECFEEFRRHDVEADRELQLDQRGRRQFGTDRVEGGIGRLVQLDDLIGEGECGALGFVETGCGLPVLQRLVLFVGDADILADTLVSDDLVGRLAQDACSGDRKFAHDRIEFAPVANRAAEPAVLRQIARRM